MKQKIEKFIDEAVKNNNYKLLDTGISTLKFRLHLYLNQ